MKTDEILIEYIKEHDEEDIQKGIGVYADNRDKIVLVSKDRKTYFVTVPRQSGRQIYAVTIKAVSGDSNDNCTCKAYQKYAQCQHTVAAALFLLVNQFGYDPEELEARILEDDDDESFDWEDFDPDFFFPKKGPAAKKGATGKAAPDKAPAPPPAVVTEPQWKSFTQKGRLADVLYQLSGVYWCNYVQMDRTVQTGFDKEALHWCFSYKEKKSEVKPEIRYDAHNTFYYRCTCVGAGQYPLCNHVRFAFAKLLQYNSDTYFRQYKDRTKEKNALLQPYGLTVADDEAKAFQFHEGYDGDLKIQAPASYIRQNDKESLKKLHRLFSAKAGTDYGTAFRSKPSADTLIDFETGFVFNAASQRLKLGFELEAAKVYRRQDKTDLKKLSLNQSQNLPLLNELTDEVYSLLLRLSDGALLDYLGTQGHSHIKDYASPWQQLSDATVALLKKQYISTLYSLWPLLNGHPNFFLLKEGKFSSVNCRPVQVSGGGVELSFSVTADERFFTVRLHPLLNGEPVERFEAFHHFLFLIDNNLHLLQSKEDLPLVQQFVNGYIRLPRSAKVELLQDIVSPLQERYTVALPADLGFTTLSVEPQPQVLLKEFNNQFLMLQPQFVYDDLAVDYSRLAEDIVRTQPDGSLQIIKRNAVLEKGFFENLRPLHNGFGGQRQNDYFYLHFNEVMKGAWFLNAVRSMQEAGITVKGMQDLQRFRYNTHPPKWEMKTGSGIDWFDLDVSISFGDQPVPLKDVRKAVLSKQNIVVLGDGSFGVLPEDWLAQYGLLLKMGEEQRDGSLRLSKLHFTLIDELHNQIDDETVLQEIEAKKQKLRNIENIRPAGVSKSLKATLRPYQISGFQWLQVLDDLGWGGCLADDMGLGKTLQAIAFLQYIKEKDEQATNLVVCPTSLIYNWEAELQKFAPGLRYHIYYGSGRAFTDEHFEAYDIVITSYALVRIDMEQLLRFGWHYVILDESQAIKNPDAQTTKAVQLLKAKNRLILSGTPVQNNTYDLFAQFNFLNAGLLGNKEFFKTEFANPIDKHNDGGKSSRLRKLVYPFLLRRTKEQVAKDLPDKTETILWCQLGKEQRSVYEDYKNYYRLMLLEKIEAEGMAKVGIYVLEGLLRLRQICNSPQLLNDAEVTTTQSVKTEELLREIEENTGRHKLLVFSQFTEMLHLLENALKEKAVSCCYLDGSTPAAKRKAQVEKFQSDEKIKVFLISLKAGGVGLNLTAADYVYLVDPWWNPAVEQQAIDRTHRIGQTQKIFAYKMICKDTVEEKILQLQQRKKQLANELVTEDAGFIKKLTKDDVAFLFG